MLDHRKQHAYNDCIAAAIENSAPIVVDININRASALFKKACDNILRNYGATCGTATPNISFSYWVDFYGKNASAENTDFKLISSKTYNLAESKSWVARRLIEKEIHNLFPVTYFSTAEALEKSNGCQLFFSKPAHLSGGRGIECVTKEQLSEYTLPKPNILQEAVEDIHLIDKKKYTGRIYILIWNKKAYLFDDGFVVIHGVPYSSNSDSYDIHVNHAGYNKEDSAVEMRLLSSLDNFRRRRLELRCAARQLAPILEEQIAASSSEQYIMLGVDFLFLKNKGLKFIEINSIPNFIHSRHINENLNIPFFENAMRLMFGLPHKRLKKIF